MPYKPFSDESSYWKHSWQKWLLLATSVLQFVLLFMNRQKYKEIAAAQILTPAAWDNYALQHTFRASLHALTGLGLLANFLIGIFAKTKQQARKAECLLLIVFAAAWAITGIIFSFSSHAMTRCIWILLLFLSSFGAIFSVYRVYKN